MPEELRELRINKSLAGKDIVAVVQKIYPKFDKTMLSKSEQGSKYGVTLRRDAMDALIVEFAPEEIAAIKRRRGGGHRLRCKVACRLEDDDYAQLQQLIKADGYSTTQAWLAEMVKQYISRNTQESKGAQNGSQRSK